MKQQLVKEDPIIHKVGIRSVFSDMIKMEQPPKGCTSPCVTLGLLAARCKENSSHMLIKFRALKYSPLPLDI